MTDNLDLRIDDLVENPTARIPVCLVLDTSGSMMGKPIRELNSGIELFFRAIKEDEVARYAAEIAVVTFGGRVQQILDFGPVEKQQVLILTADGGTPMGEAVDLALRLLEDRKSEYSAVGIDYYQPWMVLMTDGDSTDNISMASQRTRELVENRKLTVFPIGVGSSANLNTLSQFSPGNDPLRLRELNFKQFFEWLSKSVNMISQSDPGKKMKVPDTKGWTL
ncbi:MAG: hypothetical protein BWK78_07580 [Thiotrichaceae bacterium IS1]|nr:MAG: hypothetical protein BWK78_07580 [Thiotrichaceae bacterium IS1]